MKVSLPSLSSVRYSLQTCSKGKFTQPRTFSGILLIAESFLRPLDKEFKIYFKNTFFFQHYSESVSPLIPVPILKYSSFISAHQLVILRAFLSLAKPLSQAIHQFSHCLYTVGNFRRVWFLMSVDLLSTQSSTNDLGLKEKVRSLPVWPEQIKIYFCSFFMPFNNLRGFF